MRYREFNLLQGWSLRRFLDPMRFWGRYLRLVIDWTVALYLVIPGVAFLAYELTRYYHGAWTKGLTPSYQVAGPLTLLIAVQVLLIVVLLLYHASEYGNVSFPLGEADRLFLLMSPVRRRSIVMAVWLENFFMACLWFALVDVATLPLIWVFGRSSGAWLAMSILLAGYTASVKLVSRISHQRLMVSWFRWLVFQVFRFITFIPVSLLVGHVLRGQHAISWIVGMGVLIALMWPLSISLLVRRNWDPLFEVADRTLKNLAVPTGGQSRREVQIWLRKPTQVLVRMVERILGRQLTPVVWLILLRAMRKKGLLRDLSMFIVAGVSGVTWPPLLFVKVLWVGFFVFMVYQWWGFSIKPLYETAIKDQNVIRMWSLQVAASRMRMVFVAVMMTVWLVIGWLLG